MSRRQFIILPARLSKSRVDIRTTCGGRDSGGLDARHRVTVTASVLRPFTSPSSSLYTTPTLNHVSKVTPPTVESEPAVRSLARPTLVIARRDAALEL